MQNVSRQKVNSLGERHARLMSCQNNAEHDQLHRVGAIVWRPGDNTGNFFGKSFRPIGAAVLCFLHFVKMLSRGADGQQPATVVRRSPLLGFRAAPNPDGTATYDTNVFFYDARRRSRSGARGRVLDAVRNPSLVEVAMQLHRASVRQLRNTHRLPVVPEFPEIMLGFAANQLPEYEDSPALRSVAAERLGVPVGRLDSRPVVLLDALLRDLWSEQLLLPGQGRNTTEHALINAAFCTQGRRALRIYEDFSNLLGAGTWNPAREVLGSSRPNPAYQILRDHGIDPKVTDWLEAIDMDLTDVLEKAMRQALGAGQEAFTQSDIYDALTQPGKPAIASQGTPQQMFEAIGEGTVLRHMRSLLQPGVSECCTDEDLQQATLNPHGPLIASGACRTQVIYLQDLPLEEALCFTPERLGRPITANLFREWDFPYAQASQDAAPQASSQEVVVDEAPLAAVSTG